MKIFKLWTASLLFASLVVVIAINLHLNYDTAVGKELISDNMEALAQGEGPGERDCWGSGSMICGSGSYKARYIR